MPTDQPSPEDTLLPARWRVACAVLWGLASLPAFGAEVLADCDGPAFARTLQPVPVSAATPSDARAVWMSRALLRWPGADAGNRFRIYYSRSASLRLVDGHVSGADGYIALKLSYVAPPEPIATRFRYLGDGPLLQLLPEDQARLPELARGQLLISEEDSDGRVRDVSGLQLAGLLDDLYAAAVVSPPLGAHVSGNGTSWRVWAPTARQVLLCDYPDAQGKSSAALAMERDDATGFWARSEARDASGRYYRYLVDVFVPGVGIVRNRVTDPYSTSLNADSQRSYVGMPGENRTPARARPEPATDSTDMVVYELHVRDFSANDESVPAAHRGKYLAFTDADSNGMRHLRALAAAGLTDVQLLPVFDFASVPERGCVTPSIAAPARPDDEAPQAAVAKDAARDCFNWGYDPYHFNAPEGSYASNADDGAVRMREFRAMVDALHGIGLRVGMDVVYNHTSAAGQDAHSVLDRIVPGYYYRIDAKGAIEHSTCCENTATENAMMARLLLDSTEGWVRDYGIDSFRFDLMGHQPRALMEGLPERLDRVGRRHIELIGEGWNFGEVADGRRFVQASQLSLANAGIGTFSDRARDAIRGGGAGDSGAALRERKGYINGAPTAQAADMVRVGLAGTLRDYRFTDAEGNLKPLREFKYGDQPAGYAAQPGEVVAYVENHDNQTLWDIDAWRLPPGTPSAERARVQLLGAALTAFSQGIAYYHAGIDVLRSKSLDRNSFDSGDWFNRLDWGYQGNNFGVGMPPQKDNGSDWEAMRPVLDDPSARAKPEDIAFMRDAFRDLLRIRASSSLFRLRTAEDVQARLSFENVGPDQEPAIIDGHLDGTDLPDANFKEILYLVNVSPDTQSLLLPAQAGKRWQLHPVQRAATAADKRVQQARATDTGIFSVPGRTAVVWVVE
jgi:pullulanase/glycogen debranching enzyme